MKELNRGFWLVLGLCFTAVGFLGAILPVLPTIPFLIVAAFAFSKSSKRFHDWLMNHQIFGPPITDWRQTGSISRNIKWVATVSMLVGIVLGYFLGLDNVIVIIQSITISIALIFIWTRPDS